MRTKASTRNKQARGANEKEVVVYTFKEGRAPNARQGRRLLREVARLEAGAQIRLSPSLPLPPSLSLSLSLSLCVIPVVAWFSFSPARCPPPCMYVRVCVRI